MRKTFLLLGLGLFLSAIQTFAQDKLTNELIWYSPTFQSKTISGVNSMNDGVTYTRLDRADGEASINKYDYKTNKKINTLLKGSELKFNGKNVSIESYTFNATEDKLLIGSEVEPIYRHSSKGNYFIYDLNTKNLQPLTDFNLGKQSLPEFSPDGSKVVFVRNNNLFLRDLASTSEKAITTDGQPNQVINGMSDWVYEEEFSFDKAWQWSPKGSKIAFYRFDESQVPEFQMAMYGTLYPSQYTFKYPKAGEKNAVVTIHIYDLASGETRTCNTGPEKDQYIPRIKWTQDDNTLTVMRMNRLQNEMELLTFTFQEPDNARPLYHETSQTYVEVNDDLHFLKDGTFLLTSEKDGFNHIYHYSSNGKFLRMITSGKWDVTQFIGADEENQVIYYQSAETSPTQRNIYKVKMNGSGKTRLSPKDGTNNASFSKNFRYFINYHSSANTPNYVTLHDNKGNLVSVLEENKGLAATLAKFQLPKKEFFSFKASTGYVLNGWMIKPLNFDPAKKYPVFMTVYNGPGINTVNDSWGGANFLWHAMLAQEGYIVVSVDGRGTGFRGADFKKITYKQLGKYETEDQVAAARYLAAQPYADPARIGIQGWSYGGYMTLLALTKGEGVFKMGISVAPVTNWRYYDTIYTERFLRTPQENPGGYDDNSPINFAKDLKGKLLLVHGSADDNVHYQNSMEMIDALVKHNKDFDMMIYPNKNHGIGGGTTRLHLYNKMTTFIRENL